MLGVIRPELEELMQSPGLAVILADLAGYCLVRAAEEWKLRSRGHHFEEYLDAANELFALVGRKVGSGPGGFGQIR